MRTHDGGAIEAIVSIGRESPGRHELVTLGPLSNIAAVILVEPDLFAMFRHTWMMIGAADNRGNATATAEYNAWVDPEDAQIVFAAPGEKTMVDWAIARRFALMSVQDEARLAGRGELGAFAVSINRALRECELAASGSEYALADPVAMAVALDPSLITESHDAAMFVSTDASTRGQTFTDWNMPRKPATARV